MTYRFRTRLLALILCIASAAGITQAAAENNLPVDNKSFGPKVGYVTRNRSVTAGLAFQYRLSKVVRIAPEIGVIFRHRNLDGLTVDVNVHFPIPFAGERAAFYPLVGANFTSWGQHNIHPESHDDVTSHSNTFGLNAGAGLEYYCTQSLKVSVEGRYTLMRHYPTAYYTAGIAFIF